MKKLSFKPKNVVKKFMSEIGERPRDVLSQRFGVGDFSDRKTLESIGQAYGITRERVRQIENFGLNSIKESKSFESLSDIFTELKEALESKGVVLREDDILNFLSNDPHIQNHIYFLLVLGDEFTKLKEDDEFYHRWTTDAKKADMVHDVLRQLHKRVMQEDLISEKEIISSIKTHAEEMLKEKVNEDTVKSWLSMSKMVDSNRLGEWGHVESPNIRPRGMNDYAFLVLRKEGSPMKFNEVAKKISAVFNKKSHPATVHNGLIKDDRFVLVGRGLYALKDWGYKTGAVKDIIKDVIKANGPLTKEDVLKAVLKERYVKESTILVNLQNKKFFVKGSDNKYRVA